MTKTDVKEPTEVVVSGKGGAVVAAGGFDYGDKAGVGFEGTTADDLSIPFISILQSNSLQVEEKNPEGSEAGLIYNTVTRELMERMTFLPVHKEVAYVEWIPRDNGGGFVGRHDPGSDVVKKALAAVGGDRFTKLKTGDNDLIETYYVYGLILDEAGEESTGFGVVAFTSTKIKPYRDWTTSMYMLKGKPPLFANRAVITTVAQKNDHGRFHNYQIDPLSETWAASLIDPASELFKEAVGFQEMVVSGMAQADFSTQNATGDAGAPAEEGAAPF